MLSIFIKGGPIMWPLLLLSVLSFSVALERIFFLIREMNSSKDNALSEMKSLCQSNQTKGAIELGTNSKNRVAKVIAKGLESQSIGYEEAISTSALEEVAVYEEGLAILDTAITLAPLLGLLGTVTGMIKSFGLLGAAELEAPVAITGGIAEALIATAFGLGIAITALIPFNIINAKKEKFIREVESKAAVFQVLIKERLKKAA